MYKKIISIDLDGVLNEYKGNYIENEISPIKAGAYEFLEKLSKDYIIEIYTVRNKELCEKWLKQNKLNHFIRKVTDAKNPYTSVFLDDRAITFNGNYDNAYNEIINFKPFWKLN